MAVFHQQIEDGKITAVGLEQAAHVGYKSVVVQLDIVFAIITVTRQKGNTGSASVVGKNTVHGRKGECASVTNGSPKIEEATSFAIIIMKLGVLDVYSHVGSSRGRELDNTARIVAISHLKVIQEERKGHGNVHERVGSVAIPDEIGECYTLYMSVQSNDNPIHTCNGAFRAAVNDHTLSKVMMGLGP